MIGIYKITAPNKSIYIGQSWNIEKRIKSYKWINGSKQQKLLHQSFLTYGYQNHLFEKIHIIYTEATQLELDELEIKYIKFFKENGLNMLNMTLGGQTAPFKEKRVSKEVLYDLYINKNRTRGEIAKITNQKERLIKKYLNDYKIIKPIYLKNKRDEEIREANAKSILYQDKIIELKNKNMKTKDIALTLNINIGVIDNVFAKNNLAKKQKFSFKKILDMKDGTVLTLKEVCIKYSIKESCLKEQFRHNRLTHNLKLII